ncbi:hypothetical protein AB7M17_005563 [Bradyrhizobium sp. USDA 377]
MSEREISNPADFLAWHREAQAGLERRAALMRQQMEKNAMRWVQREVKSGCDIQEAGDRFVRAMKSLRTPADQAAAAVVALSQIGWRPKQRGRAE